MEDNMRNKLYWGLAILIIIVISVAVVMLTRTTDTEPITIYKDVDPSKPINPSTKKLEDTDKFAKWWEENRANLVTNDTEQAKENGQKGQQANKTPDWHSLTPEQQQQIFDQFYTQFGLEVPPEGYDYLWKDIGIPYTDENGKPVLRRLDEPTIDIEYGIGFAPTLEEFEKFKKLDLAWGLAKAEGNTAKEQQLKSEIDALTASVQRMRPLFIHSASTNAEQKSKIDRMSKEAMRNALREYGLEHLISYGLWDK